MNSSLDLKPRSPSTPVPDSGASRSPPVWSDRAGRGLLLGWWLLIFTATHVPMPHSVEPSQIPDKWIHFGMYLVLGGLVGLWGGWREVAARKRLGVWFGILTVYAVVDELLQIPVGRTADWLDGAADLAGAACGLLIAFVVHRRLYRVGK